MPTKLQIERWGPLTVATIVVVGWWVANGVISGDVAKELLGALLSAASIAAGFLTTALSILLSMASSPTGQRLKRSGYLEYLYSYLREAIFGCLLLAAVCVFSFFNLEKDRSLHEWLAALVIFGVAYAGAALARIAEVLMNLLERAHDDAP